jgi:hypothetical protein
MRHFFFSFFWLAFLSVLPQKGLANQATDSMPKKVPLPANDCQRLNQMTAKKVISKLESQYPEIKFNLSEPIVWDNFLVCEAPSDSVKNLHIAIQWNTFTAKLQLGGGQPATAVVKFQATRLCLTPLRTLSSLSEILEADTSLQWVPIESMNSLMNHQAVLTQWPGTLLQTRFSLPLRQCIPKHALKRLPDKKQGQPVKLKILNNAITLQTQATLTADAFEDLPASVVLQKPGSKRSFSGILRKDSVVEVAL